MIKLSQGAEKAVRQLVKDLVNGHYTEIEADGRIGRLTKDELRRAVAEYGRRLTQLPEGAIEAVDVYPTDGVLNQASVDVPLWTEEEGQSDLTLSVIIREEMDRVTVTISDLHVL